MRIQVFIGTRPEAIKLAPVVDALRHRRAEVQVCLTGQQQDLLDQTTTTLGLTGDRHLTTMVPGQSLSELEARLLAGCAAEIRTWSPDAVLVQGDTATVLMAAWAAWNAKVPIGHVEAGLRTGDYTQPWPEEMHRVLVARLARWHYAPTTTARDHLLREGIAASDILVTGNTGIDALARVCASLDQGRLQASTLIQDFLHGSDGCHRILVTLHRRENHGAPLERMAQALAILAERVDLRIILPLHPNPAVSEPLRRLLGNHPRIALVPSLPYVDLVAVLRCCRFTITDSGGIQEEAPFLGIPVLVAREATERPEAVAVGAAELVGTDPDRMLAASGRLLDDAAFHAGRAQVRCPFGDGHGAERIADHLLSTCIHSSCASPTC